jgi:uncharacterized protein (TIGR02118 family)
VNNRVEERAVIKAFVLIHRRADLSWDDFSRYFREVHGPLAPRLPGLRHYEQHHIRSAFFGGEAPCDAIAELWFDDEDALRAAFDSDAGRAALADNRNFTDEQRTRLVVGTE